MTILLPGTFTATHETAGLPGYPAIDVFGKPGEPFRIQLTGTVRRRSGHPCKDGGTPGGAYGQSIYIETPDGDDRYLTHIDKLLVSVGEHITPATILGTICDSAVSHKPGTSHIHYGHHKAAHPSPPVVRLYDVDGPRGGKIARKRDLAYITKHADEWVKLFGRFTVRAAHR